LCSFEHCSFEQEQGRPVSGTIVGMDDSEWVWHGKRKRRVYAVVRVDHDFLIPDGEMTR
jgi:hypothetical protein